MVPCSKIFKFLFVQVIFLAADFYAVVNYFLSYHSCQNYVWAYYTIIIPFLPGLPVAFGLFFRACTGCDMINSDKSKTRNKSFLKDARKGVQYLFFPLFHLFSSLRGLFQLFRIEITDQRYADIWFHSYTLKWMKATFDSTFQLILQCRILLISSFDAGKVLLVVLSTLSICFASSASLDVEICRTKRIPDEDEPPKRIFKYIPWLFFTIASRIIAWTLIWTYFRHYAIIFVVIVLFFNWTISWFLYPEGEQSGFNLPRFVFCLMDAMSNMSVSVFPKSMKSTALVTGVILSTFLGLLSLLLYSEVPLPDPNYPHYPAPFSCLNQMDHWRRNQSSKNNTVNECSSWTVVNQCQGSDKPWTTMVAYVLPVALLLQVIGAISVYFLYWINIARPSCMTKSSRVV